MEPKVGVLALSKPVKHHFLAPGETASHTQLGPSALLGVVPWLLNGTRPERAEPAAIVVPEKSKLHGPIVMVVSKGPWWRSDVLERVQELLQVLVWGTCWVSVKGHWSGKTVSAEWPCWLPALLGTGQQVVWAVVSYRGQKECLYSGAFEEYTAPASGPCLPNPWEKAHGSPGSQ